MPFNGVEQLTPLRRIPVAERCYEGDSVRVLYTQRNFDGEEFSGFNFLWTRDSRNGNTCYQNFWRHPDYPLVLPVRNLQG